MLILKHPLPRAVLGHGRLAMNLDFIKLASLLSNPSPRILPCLTLLVNGLISTLYSTGMCKEVFGKGENEVEIAVEKTNKFYGGRSIREKTSKTFFLNGSVDPWHALGETTPSHSLSVPVVFIKGTAHCADLYPPRDRYKLLFLFYCLFVSTKVNYYSDLPELTQARAKVVSFLKHWLQN